MSVIYRFNWRTRATITLVVVVVMALSQTVVALASGSSRPLKLSSDPFTNSSSQHKTQVEPDTYSNGSTIISAFQSGRFFSGGSSDISWATSLNNGVNWQHGFLPGTTPYSTPPGTYTRVSDPSVAYDAKHSAWIISFVGLTQNGGGGEVDVLISRSTNGGLTWGNPIRVDTSGPSFDKDWIVCDDTESSPFYGNCYTEFDNSSQSNIMLMSTSSDGGNTWGTAQSPSNQPHGTAGQPLVQPDGTVIVPFKDHNGTISSFSSINGGSSWNTPVTIATLDVFKELANIRSSPFPSAEIDGLGTVYVAWQDCRFENACSANDIVFSTSNDGIHWSAVQRVTADPVNSGIDHFIPGFAVDKSTSGSSAHLAVVYYYFPVANCTSDCQLDVGYSSSIDAGAHWTSSLQLAGPMKLTWLANTDQGYMVGDYISTSISADGKAYPVFALAKKNKGSNLNEAMYTVKDGLLISSGTNPFRILLSHSACCHPTAT